MIPSTAADVPGGFQAHTDVCIVGSGSGGGVAAWTLAMGGRNVLVLEEGPHVPASRMTQREEDMYPLLYRDGGNQATHDGGIQVLQGRAVGGSTVINMADVVPTPRPILEHWRTHYGLDRFSVDEVDQASALCMERIGANPIRPEDLNRNNALLLEGAAKLGLSGGRFVHNRVGCVGSGYCMVGCAYDAKRSVALTFLPEATATGRARVQADATVTALEVRNGRVAAVTGHLTGNPAATFRVEANHFVLACGAIHTPLLLLQAGLGGRRVGRNLSLQPQTPVAALFDEDVVPWRGVPQAAFVDHFDIEDPAEGLGGYRLEGVTGTPGMSAASTALYGEKLFKFMQSFKQSTACLCLVPDRPTGRVRRQRDGRPRIDYTLTAPVERTLREAARTAAKVYLAAGARAVLLPFPDVPAITRVEDLDVLEHRRFRSARSPLISAHPQGTCRMGPDPRHAVVDLEGRLHDMPNVSVLDASIFPTSASTHTMLPVMAFAHLGAQALLA